MTISLFSPATLSVVDGATAITLLSVAFNTTHIVAASGHDWHTAGLGLEAGLTWLLPRVKLEAP